MRNSEVTAFLQDAKRRYGRYWRKSAREPGAERELAEIALDRLRKLRLIARNVDIIRPLPALDSFALGHPELRGKTGASTPKPANLL